MNQILVLPEVTCVKDTEFVFPVIDPSTLPIEIRKAFNDFMAGQSAPHFLYVYEQDYIRFKKLVGNGHITIQAENP